MAEAVLKKIAIKEKTLVAMGSGNKAPKSRGRPPRTTASCNPLEPPEEDDEIRPVNATAQPVHSPLPSSIAPIVSPTPTTSAVASRAESFTHNSVQPPQTSLQPVLENRTQELILFLLMLWHLTLTYTSSWPSCHQRVIAWNQQHHTWFAGSVAGIFEWWPSILQCVDLPVALTLMYLSVKFLASWKGGIWKNSDVALVAALFSVAIQLVQMFLGKQ